MSKNDDDLINRQSEQIYKLEKDIEAYQKAISNLQMDLDKYRNDKDDEIELTLEKTMQLMQKYNVPYFEDGGIKIQMILETTGVTMPVDKPEKNITNEDILMSPYAGLDEG